MEAERIPTAHLLEELQRLRAHLAACEAAGCIPPEHVLRHPALQFRRLFDANVVGIIAADINGNITEANDAFLHMVGYQREDLPLRWDALTPPEWHAIDRAKITEVMATGVGMPWEKEYLGKDARRVPILVGVALLDGSMGDCICIVIDLTAHKHAEHQLMTQQAQLRRLASELVVAEERERRRIARGLHDQLGQLLALAGSKLAALLESPAAGGISGPLTDIGALLDQAIQETRSLTFELSSPVLYELGLEAALQGLGEQTGEQHGMRVHFVDDHQPKPLTDEMRTVLYRVARELLVNIVKHAQARHVWLAVSREGEHLHLTIRDDGVGFNAYEGGDALYHTRGFGLFSIRQQVEYLGGHVEIDTVAGGGTRVAIIAPLA
jgi:PAS domain S-box-containing protein